MAVITGTAGDDTLNGTASADELYGLEGNDTLIGGGGADQLFGGGGTDTASYVGSLAVTINTKTGVHTGGDAAGDVFNSIEIILGSNNNDVFISGLAADSFNGNGGTLDVIDYSGSGSAVNVNLATNVHTGGDAAGDSLVAIERVIGSAFGDTLTGNVDANFFDGGAGADAIDGAGGLDTVYYLTSSSAITVNLLAGTATGGDAAGDTFVSIENIFGSIQNDSITGNTLANVLQGGNGNDTLSGGDGNDTIYGGVSTSLNYANSGVQADTIYGGNGADIIYSAAIYGGPAIDTGTVIYGEAGDDQIQAVDATVYGGDGNDTLWGYDSSIITPEVFALYGDAGADIFYMNDSGFAFGGQDGDTYNVYNLNIVAIQDTGTLGTDTVYLDMIATFSDVRAIRFGVEDDMYVTSAADWADGIVNSGVKLIGWFAGVNTIEDFKTADGVIFHL